MPDERADSDEHGPAGYEGDTRRGGGEPPGYIGIRDHGTPGEGERGFGRKMASNVWGGAEREVTSEHGESCGYCGFEWPNSVCMSANTHPGVDIGIVRGTALRAAAGGSVEFAGWGEYYRPHHVDIRTPSGELHIYAHMWSVDSAVRVGGSVQAGQYLGTSGEQTVKGTMTPDGTGPHLHFERRRSNNCALDPEEVLTGAPGGGLGGDGGGEPLHCAPDPAPESGGEPVTINNVVFHPAKQRVESKIEGLRRRKWAHSQACETGQRLDRGEQIRVLFWVKGEDVEGEERWWVAEDGSRIWSGGTVEKP